MCIPNGPDESIDDDDTDKRPKNRFLLKILQYVCICEKIMKTNYMMLVLVTKHCLLMANSMAMALRTSNVVPAVGLLTANQNAMVLPVPNVGLADRELHLVPVVVTNHCLLTANSNAMARLQTLEIKFY